MSTSVLSKSAAPEVPKISRKPEVKNGGAAEQQKEPPEGTRESQAACKDSAANTAGEDQQEAENQQAPRRARARVLLPASQELPRLKQGWSHPLAEGHLPALS